MQNINYVLDSADEFKLNKKCDVITATGLISWFNDPSKLLDYFPSHLKDDGTILITNGFSTSEYDIIVRYRHHEKRDTLIDGWSQHSISGIEKYVARYGKTVTRHKFEMPFELERQSDILRSWTIQTNEGQKFTNGLNLVWNLWTLEMK